MMTNGHLLDDARSYSDVTILVVRPHPDDETSLTGCLLARQLCRVSRNPICSTG